MAEDNNEELEGGKGGGKKKLIIIIVAVVLLLGGGAGAYFFFFAGDGEAVEETQETAEESTETLSASYVPMPRPFVFNVKDRKRDRLVQIKVQLLVRGNDKVSLSKKHIPLLEDTLVRVFATSTAEQLRSPEGKRELRDFALQALNKASMKYENQELIDSVLFTGFVLQ